MAYSVFLMLSGRVEFAVWVRSSNDSAASRPESLCRCLLENLSNVKKTASAKPAPSPNFAMKILVSYKILNT